MYFAYIDESGTPEKNDTPSQEFVLTAIIVHERDWFYIQRACNDLKFDIWQRLEDTKTYIPADDFELHLKQICNKTGYFECLLESDKKWFEIVDKIYNKIADLNITIITSIIIKDKFFQKYDDVSKWAFTLLVERLQRFMTAINPKNDEYLLLVMDTVNLVFDNEKRNNVEEFIKFGTGHGWKESITQVIETPFFVDSRIHNGVQLADAIAYLIRRYTFKYLNRNPSAFFNQYVDDLMKKIIHLFYRGTSIAQIVQGNSIKIFPHTFNIGKQFWSIFDP